MDGDWPESEGLTLQAKHPFINVPVVSLPDGKGTSC